MKAKDPICGMMVDAAPTTLHAEVGGRTFYFCAESCRQRYLAVHPATRG
jgi:P-type Cu+ transporter